MAGEAFIGAFLIFYILLIVAVIAFCIWVFIFWILMLIDCAKRNFKSEGEKIAWILVIVLAHWLGAVIYYFVVKVNDKKQKK